MTSLPSSTTIEPARDVAVGLARETNSAGEIEPNADRPKQTPRSLADWLASDTRPDDFQFCINSGRDRIFQRLDDLETERVLVRGTLFATGKSELLDKVNAERAARHVLRSLEFHIPARGIRPIPTSR